MEFSEEESELERSLERKKKWVTLHVRLWWVFGLWSVIRDLLGRFRRWRLGGNERRDRLTVFTHAGESVFRQNLQDEVLLPYKRHTHFYVLESRTFTAEFTEQGLRVRHR